MVRVEISKVCGICAGCKYAIDKVNELLQGGKKVTIFKNIVHNKNVCKMLKDAGANTEDELSKLSKDSTILLRAHGEPPETYDYLRSRGISYVDCTCRNVVRIHECVRQKHEEGYTNIIIGKYGKHSGIIHPEVLGTMGYAGGDYILIEDDDDLQKLLACDSKKFYLTCQTTFAEGSVDLLISEIQSFCDKNGRVLEVNKSICAAQRLIKQSSAELAKTVDLMVVVGSRNSSNTVELFNDMSRICKTVFLEDIYACKAEFEANNIKIGADTKIGLTAGASTLKSELETLKSLLEKEYGEGL